MIDMGLYRRFYRQKRRSFAGAGDGAICAGATFLTQVSTNQILPRQTLLGKVHPMWHVTRLKSSDDDRHFS